MRAAVALLLTLTMTLAGCFPHDAHKRTIAKAAEGGSLVVGIIISALANTGADCDANNTTPGSMDTGCRSTAKILSTVGVTLILAGLVGFIATVSTAEDEDQTKAVTTSVPDTGKKPPTNPTTTPDTTTTTTTTPPTTPPTDSGSGAGSTDGAGSGSSTPPPSP